MFLEKMLESSITLYEYLPNHREGTWFEYDGVKLVRLSDVPPFQRLHGYVVPYLDYKLRKNVAVLFGENEKLFLDLGSGPVELKFAPASVAGFGIWRKVCYQTALGPVTIDVFTPPLRYLTNDGQFPEDIEPIVHLLESLTNPAKNQRFLQIFATGSYE